MGIEPTPQTAEPELIYLIESIGVLPVILDDIDVVGGCEETCEGRGMRIPKRGRDDSCNQCISI